MKLKGYRTIGYRTIFPDRPLRQISAVSPTRQLTYNIVGDWKINADYVQSQLSIYVFAPAFASTVFISTRIKSTNYLSPSNGDI